MDSKEERVIHLYVRSHKAIIRGVCPFTYREAMEAKSLLKAFKILKRLGDKHNLLVVKPRECVSTGERERTAAGFIPRVGGLGPAKSRVEGSRIVPEFSPGAEKPKPRRRRKRVRLTHGKELPIYNNRWPRQMISRGSAGRHKSYLEQDATTNG